MKKAFLVVITAFASTFGFSQDENYQLQIDSIEKSFTYEHGTVTLRNGIGNIEIPTGFKYLEPVQAEKVLVDLWGNPRSPDITLGLILPEHQGILSDSGYVFNVQYDEIGYVKDDDADEIDYDELLTQMQQETEEENQERVRQNYEPITIVGWAAKPFYDKDKKILHWAKEVKFGNNEINTLNYNIRVLGRKGVIVLNAIASMPHLPMVQKDINKVLTIVKFNEGLKYENFDSSIDEVAAWTIGGLVAGKVLAKVGFLALILKFWKLIALAVAGFFGAFWKKFKKKKEENGTTIPETKAIDVQSEPLAETQPLQLSDNTTISTDETLNNSESNPK
ncbi:MAG: DUF2167 domain-containing protein [Bacteroidia bacterium]